EPVGGGAQTSDSADSTARPTPYDPVRRDGGDGGFPALGSLPDLGGFRLVVLCNVAEVTDAAAETLARFVTAGGGLLIFTGDRVRSGAYDPLRRRGLLPVQVQGPGDPGLYRFGAGQKDHPISPPFDAPQHGDLRSWRFHRLPRLVLDAGARGLATVEGKLPLLVESSSGRGRCLLCAVPADN